MSTRDAGVWASLSPSVLNELSAGVREVTYSRGDTIVRVGERCDPGIVLRGVIKSAIRSDDGRSATVRYMTENEMFGWESLFRPMSHFVIALTPVRVQHHDRVLCDQLSRKHPSLAQRIAHELSESISRTNEAVAALAFMTVAQRVVHHLVTTASLGGDENTGDAVRLSQQQLADAVGSVREVVARVIRDLKGQRLVETSPSGVRVIDELGLYRFAFASSGIRYVQDPPDIS